MRAHWMTWFLSAAITAALAACTPPAGGGGDDISKAEGDAEAEDSDDPDKPADPGGGCGDTGGPVCTKAEIGDGTTCLDDAAILSAAQGACTAAGNFIATEIYPAFDCEDGSSKVWIVCCDSGVPGDVPADPPDPAPAGGLGDGVTCYANSDLQTQAEAACAELGLSLLEFYTANDCVGGSYWAKYICGE